MCAIVEEYVEKREKETAIQLIKLGKLTAEEFAYIYYRNHKTLRCFCKGGVATSLYFF